MGLGHALLTVLLVLSILVVPWAVVSSYSMEPTLEVGDLVIMAPTIGTCQSLLGHVAIYYSPQFGDLIVHRAVAIENVQGCIYVFKGDANLGPDPYPVPRYNVVGVVQFVIPQLGFVSLSYRSYTALLYMLGLIILVVIPAYILDK
ncbi:MAG: signal peptidase I [Vulcanisaeta sp.]|jgi:signal peptidase|nr:signal peptidase I [Vulcanisaeta sp.]MCG2869172.1 signal peptidase I [Vulcanisaeta sp.]MCG2879827.1 signal peptidase I [Vulcanisaeta sp.]MCG2886533.1 signal peptidase I [Vulcanisaeta sp.]